MIFTRTESAEGQVFNVKYAIVIPARHASSRLPGRPLIDLCGVPMVVRTYRQCVHAAPAEQVFVATDSEDIRRTCKQAGIRTVMTSSRCLTGTDRVAEVAEKIGADTFINVRGDETLAVGASRDAWLAAGCRFLIGALHVNAGFSTGVRKL